MASRLVIGHRRLLFDAPNLARRGVVATTLDYERDVAPYGG